MSNINDNIRKSVKKGEEIFKTNSKKSNLALNRANNYKINLMKIEKIVKLKKEDFSNRNNMIKLDDDELTKINQKRTFIETITVNNESQFNNYMNKIIQNRRNNFFHSFINPNANSFNTNYFNKNKLFINNRRIYKNNIFLTISSFKNTIKKNSTTFITKRTENSDQNLINNKLKKRKDLTETYNNNKRIKQNINNNISNTNYDISKIIPRKKNLNKKLSSIKTNNLNDKVTILKKVKKEKEEKKEKKEKKEEMENDNFILDIEPEKINSINKLKIENYNINKPNEYKMKFCFLNEYNDEKNSPNNNNKEEKVIIGKIEGYKDIIESDKLYLKNKLNKQNKTKLIKQKEKIEKENNILKNLEGLSILEENSSEFYDLNILNYNYCKTNKILENIENEYEFEDLSTYEYENKINKNKLILFNNEKAK